jgi:hypothetical protein
MRLGSAAAGNFSATFSLLLDHSMGIRTSGKREAEGAGVEQCAEASDTRLQAPQMRHSAVA